MNRKCLCNFIINRDYKLFEALLDLYGESSSMETSASFTYGFKLGALVMIEVLSGKEEVVRKRVKRTRLLTTQQKSSNE
ncbi:DUF6809 family protein [Lucifera butyrica]|uniref:DUF6809 family protein n=1 Tax=Lucifera butyrica TaxID=1351585 RepID=UPI001403B2A0|nr:DUF6809 family protein [Lucifera butyrica]